MSSISPIIDDHCHIGSPDHYHTDAWVDSFIKAGFERGIQVAVSEEATGESLPNPLALSGKDVVKRMDEAGVNKTIVVAFDSPRWKTKVPNEFVAEEVKKYPKRLIGLASVNILGGNKAVRELEYAIQELKLFGLKIAPNYDGVSPADLRLYPIYEAASDLKIPVEVHTGFSVGGVMKYENPDLLDDVALHFPELKIIMVHSGYQWAHLAVMMMLKHPNVWGDIAWWYAWPLENLVYLIKLAKHFGVLDKLMWGSDNFEPKKDIKRIKTIPQRSGELAIAPGLEEILPEDIAKILGLNACRCLNIKV